MACRDKDNEASSAVELIAERGLEGLGEALTMLINTAMRQAGDPRRLVEALRGGSTWVRVPAGPQRPRPAWHEDDRLGRPRGAEGSAQGGVPVGALEWLPISSARREVAALNLFLKRNRWSSRIAAFRRLID